jgi:hypothetical protein
VTFLRRHINTVTGTSAGLQRRLLLNAYRFQKKNGAFLFNHAWVGIHGCSLIPLSAWKNYQEKELDCLETLEEIAIEGKESFLHSGGESFTIIPCLNVHPLWVEAMVKWIEEYKKGSKEMVLVEANR